jgi:hypothetical protein
MIATNGRSWGCPNCDTEIVATTCCEFTYYCKRCDVHFKIICSKNPTITLPAEDAGRDIIFEHPVSRETIAYVAFNKEWPNKVPVTI